MKNKISPGLEETPLEVWKIRSFNDILLERCNATHNQSSTEIWTRGCILPFPKKWNLSLTTNYRRTTIAPFAAKIYNSMMLNRIQPETEKVLRPNQNSFRRNRSNVGQILTVQVIIEGVRVKAMIWSPNGDTDFFDVLASVFQGGSGL